tara:strand:+ start:212 stop:559 length:348 start_codon:yes stop_codon:yes gene_type:complete
MLEFFIISIGSILGSLIRWKIDNIFFVNILGCFIFGFINNLQISKKFKLFFCFSFCGSLTTFSGWILDLFNIFNKRLYLLFLFKVILFLVIGYFALYLGYLISNNLNKLKFRTKV